jgi:hypothetical protein
MMIMMMMMMMVMMMVMMMMMMMMMTMTMMSRMLAESNFNPRSHFGSITSAGMAQLVAQPGDAAGGGHIVAIRGSLRILSDLTYDRVAQLVVDVPQLTAGGYVAWRVAGCNLGRAIYWELRYWAKSVMGCTNYSQYRKDVLRNESLPKLENFCGFSRMHYAGGFGGVGDTVVASPMMYLFLVRRYHQKRAQHMAAQDLGAAVRSWGQKAIEGLALIPTEAKCQVPWLGQQYELRIDSQGYVQGWNAFMGNCGAMARSWYDFVLMSAGEGLAALRPGPGNCVCTVLLFLISKWPGYLASLRHNKRKKRW